MPVDALVPNDPRVEHKFFETVGTIVLQRHGCKPDFALDWRFQIPFLASLGLQVLAPDMLARVRGGPGPSLHAKEGQLAVIMADEDTLLKLD
ncbi:hypothetical protein F5X96DRAFT_672345 [Biscogniauxia mediterranea]|nr:hypothetical protein F5X96DRAFT_672345 [Biscogniauxia mediterranea]